MPTFSKTDENPVREDKPEYQRMFLIFVSCSLNNFTSFVHIFLPYPMHNLICTSFYLLPLIMYYLLSFKNPLQKPQVHLLSRKMLINFAYISGS